MIHISLTGPWAVAVVCSRFVLQLFHSKPSGLKPSGLKFPVWEGVKASAQILLLVIKSGVPIVSPTVPLSFSNQLSRCTRVI